MSKILFIGFTSIDIIQGERFPGGAAAAMSLNASYLGHESSLMSALSTDELGKYYTRILKEHNVDISLSSLASPSLPTCIINDPLASNLERLWSDNGAYKVFEKFPLNPMLLNRFDALVFNNCYPALVKKISRCNLTAKIFYTPGLFATFDPPAIDQQLLSKCTAVFANDDEYPSVNQLNPIKLGTQILIHTQGSQGVAVKTKKTSHHYPAPKVKKVVDTTGAGDAFALGFITSYLETQTIQLAIDSGLALAANNIQRKSTLLFDI